MSVLYVKSSKFSQIFFRYFVKYLHSSFCNCNHPNCQIVFFGEATGTAHVDQQLWSWWGNRRIIWIPCQPVKGQGGGGRYRISGRSAEIPCQLGITCQLARAEFRAGDAHFVWRSVCGGSMKCSTMSCWDTPLKGQEISDMKWPRMNCWRVQILTN